MHDVVIVLEELTKACFAVHGVRQIQSKLPDLQRGGAVCNMRSWLFR